MNPIVAPLTFGQLSLWRSEEVTPVADRPEWHLWRVWRIPVGTSVEAVRTVLAAMAEHHEALRTIFDLSKPVPDQMIMPAAPVPVTVESRSECSSAQAAQVAQELAAEPFDLASEYGWRVAITADESGIPGFLCLAFHHMTADAYAINLLKNEWRRLIGDPDADALWDSPSTDDVMAPSTGRLQPRQLAELQHSPAWANRHQAAVRYWTSVLSHYPVPTQEVGSGMSFGRKSERIQATLTSATVGPALGRIAAKHGVTAPTAALAVTLKALAAFDVVLTEPLLLMASNRFDPRWQGLVTTMNQAAILDLVPMTDDFGAFIESVEGASRVAYRHGCYDIDEFTTVVTRLRGAELNYDFFFNYGAHRQTTAPDDWTGAMRAQVDINAAPQQTGPRLQIRITGFEQLTFDLRADSTLISAETLPELVAWIGEQTHALAR